MGSKFDYICRFQLQEDDNLFLIELYYDIHWYQYEWCTVRDEICLDWGVSPKFVIRTKSYVLVPEAFVGSYHVIQNGRRSVGEAIYIISYW